MNTPTIRKLDFEDSVQAVGLLVHLNPDLPTAELRARFEAILRDHPHYQALGAFCDGKLVGLLGVWIATKVWCGRYLELDNFIVHPLYQGAGIGTALLRAAEALGHEQNCQVLTLDSYTSNHPSHRLYHRLGFEIWGFHFVKPLRAQTIQPTD